MTNPYDIHKVRRDFPILSIQMNGKPLVYLDNAATAQKPERVIRRIHDFYQREYATVHRGVYTLSQNSTWECEQVRDRCRKFLNAPDRDEIIFVSGATEAINLVASGYGRPFISTGDEILITEMEHHANIIPWQQICLEKGARLKVAPINDEGEIILEQFRKFLSPKTKMVAVTHMSNALGSINPVRRMAKLAHEAGAVILVDGAQGVVHASADVRELDCDFYCFSGHKIYGPTGVGVLWGRKQLLEKMEPYQTGGEMIKTVTFEKTTFAGLPQKFEAGTPPIAQIVGLGAALDYLETLGVENIRRHEKEILDYATEKLAAIAGLRIVGRAKSKGGVISFTLDGIHPHDIGTVLDQEGIAIRTGHHCAQPLMQRYGLPATARASFGLYNTRDEVDVLVRGITKVQEIFR